MIDQLEADARRYQEQITQHEVNIAQLKALDKRKHDDELRKAAMRNISGQDASDSIKAQIAAEKQGQAAARIALEVTEERLAAERKKAKK